MSRPVVLVMSSQNAPGFPDVLLELADSFVAGVLAACEHAGLDARLVNVNDRPLRPVEHLLDGVDGVALLGGGDVDPTIYGAPADSPRLYGVDREADDALIALIRETLDRDVPVLGICRGGQLLNVALGGTLIPDIEEWELHRGDTPETIFLTETVALVEGSVLAELYGATLPVLNGHHQAIAELGEDLVVAARAQDGLVEAVEHRSRWAIGVQWHPEHPDAGVPDRELLFGRFRDAVAARRVHARGAGTAS